MERLYRFIINNISDAVIEIDREGKVISVNPAFTSLFDYRSGEVLNQSVLSLFSKDSRKRFRSALRAITKETAQEETANRVGINKLLSKQELSLSGIRKDGQSLVLNCALLLASSKKEPRYLAIFDDLTQYSRLANELQVTQDSYWTLSETTTDAILQIKESLKIQYANTAVKRVFGYDRKELIDRDFACLFPPSAYKRHGEAIKKYFFIDDIHRKNTKLTNTIDILGLTKDNDIVPLEISFGNSISVDDERLLTCIIRDVTERKRTDRKLRHLAYHDQLTDLGNRDLFAISLKDYLSQIKRHHNTIGALLFMDLDKFKKVNDTLGHNIGDQILKECSRRLNECLRESDHIYRLGEEAKAGKDNFKDLFRFGGDEFVILLTHLKTSTDAAVVAQKIITAVKKPYYIKDFVEKHSSVSEITLGASIGMALIPENGQDPSTLISNADVAMYKAKELGNRYMFFTKEMNTKATERLILEGGLRNALENDEFCVHYQPIVAADGSIKGAEALIRWVNSEGDNVSPSKFIPIAEETGLIVLIGEWIFESACRQLKIWNDKFNPDLYLSVNLSSKQLIQNTIVDRVNDIIHSTGIRTGNLRLEITESGIMIDPHESRIKMEGIKQNNEGVMIAIDDFGTGYSSLSYLSEFPVDILKIDRAFVSHLDNNINIKIVNTVIALAQNLNLELVAEGVESESQVKYLISRGCDIFQGFYFSKPMPAEVLTAQLASISDDVNSISSHASTTS